MTSLVIHQKRGHHLGDNFIKKLHLGRYIVGYTVGNLVIQRSSSGAVKVISNRISEDMPPLMKIFDMVIPILMHFCIFVSNWSIASCTSSKDMCRN